MAKDKLIQIRVMKAYYDEIKEIAELTHTTVSEFARLGIHLARVVYTDPEMYKRVFGSSMPLPPEFFEQFDKQSRTNEEKIIEAIGEATEAAKRLHNRIETIEDRLGIIEDRIGINKKTDD